MRPLFAIAPLAALFALMGPTPQEATKTLADIKAYFQPAKHTGEIRPERRSAATQPSLSYTTPSFTAGQAGTVFQAEIRR